MAVPVTPEAPHVRSRWNVDRVSLLLALSLVPPFSVALFERGFDLVEITGASLAATMGWQVVFSYWRGRTIGVDGIATALTFALLAPAAPLWQLALAISFGVVVGEQVFGGRGLSFVSPATAGLAFLFFAFPTPAVGGPSPLVAAAVLPGAVVLVAAGLVSWRIVLGILLGAAAVLLIAGADPAGGMAQAHVALGIVYLAGDPAATASTRGGRWLTGILIGLLMTVLDRATMSVAAVVFAVLLGNVFAPTFDHWVVALHARRRRQARG
jgi:Na+-transporting NADH:ubiquinone oxidoreductase subunit B